MFPPFSLTHNFWRQIWTTRHLVVCTRTSLQLGAYLSSKNQNHSVKLLLNKLKTTNQRKVTLCFQNCSRLGSWTQSYFFSMFSLTLETKMTQIHCTSSGCLNTVLEYIKCIKRTCKVGDFKLETSEEQRLDLLDSSVRCWVLVAKICRSFCWSSAAVIELKRKGWSFFFLIQLLTRQQTSYITFLTVLVEIEWFDYKSVLKK